MAGQILRLAHGGKSSEPFGVSTKNAGSFCFALVIELWDYIFSWLYLNKIKYA